MKPAPAQIGDFSAPAKDLSHQGSTPVRKRYEPDAPGPSSRTVSVLPSRNSAKSDIGHQYVMN